MDGTSPNAHRDDDGGGDAVVLYFLPSGLDEREKQWRTNDFYIHHMERDKRNVDHHNLLSCSFSCATQEKEREEQERKSDTLGLYHKRKRALLQLRRSET